MSTKKDAAEVVDLESPEVADGSEWYGDKADGIEIRRHGGQIDEIVVYRDGECVVHVEAMSDQCFWMSLMSKRFEVHANCYSKNGRSHVEMNADGWSRKVNRTKF